MVNSAPWPARARSQRSRSQASSAWRPASGGALAASSCGGSSARGGVAQLERGVVAQDRALEPSQLRPRLDADLGEQRGARRVKGRQRIGLLPAAIEGEHELPGEPLAGRGLGHELSQLAGERDVAARGQVGLDAVLEGGEPLLLEARDLRLRERLEREIGERRATPQRQRLAQDRRRVLGPPAGQRATPLLHEAREAIRVELVGADAQAIAGGCRGEHVGVAERLAQPRHVDLDGLHRARRNLVAPQRERQPLRVHGLVGMQQQHGQHRPGLDPSQRHRARLVAHFQRPEYAVLHAAHATPTGRADTTAAVLQPGASGVQPRRRTLLETSRGAPLSSPHVTPYLTPRLLPREARPPIRTTRCGPPPPGEQELVAIVRAAGAGDADAWTRLVERFDGSLRHIARSYRLAPADVDDVVQGAWLELLTAIGQIREPAAIGGWLATVTRRNALRARRRPARELLTDDPELGDRDDGHGPEERALAAEREAILAGAIAALPERPRLLVTVLLTEPELDYRQVGERLSMPVGSIGPSRTRALARLARDARLRAVAA